MMSHHILLMLGLLLVTGLLFSLLATKISIPRIAAYAMAGLVWSPDLLGGWFELDMTSWSGTLTDTSLAIVAYLIGGSITLKQLRRLGKTIMWCTVGEVAGAVLLVTAVIWWWLSGTATDALSLALILGVLAASTAPAATVAVIHQYRSKGPLTTTLLGVVALDDAFGIILFSLMLVGLAGSSLMDAVSNSFIEIGGALILGSLIGALLAFFGHHVRNQNFLLPMVLSAIILSQGLAGLGHFSPLLTAMSLGFVARAVFVSGGERLLASVEYLEELVFLTFFTLAGAHFEISVFLQGIDLVLLYVIARVVGKVIGTRTAARLSGAEESVRKYIGFGVVPQAGIAIGLALSLLHSPILGEQALLILNVILASTLIYEVLGPFATRYALYKAGEVNNGKHINHD